MKMMMKREEEEKKKADVLRWIPQFTGPDNETRVREDGLVVHFIMKAKVLPCISLLFKNDFCIQKGGKCS